MIAIITFEETPNQQRTIVLTCFQILSQARPMEEACVELVKGAINQPIKEDEANLTL
jgi:hypothetical protein